VVSEQLSTKEKILESALRLFSQKGYLGTATREIARDAGVAEVTVFRHFSTKERLLEEVFQKYSFLPDLKNILPEVSNLDYREALSIIVKSFLNSLFLRKEMIKIIKSEIFTYPEPVIAFYQTFLDELYKTLASYFENMQRKGHLREFDPKLGARALLGMIFSFFEVEECILNKEGSQKDYDRVIKEFIEIFIRGTQK
jgi:AcrR family transcriptional regulator